MNEKRIPSVVQGAAIAIAALIIPTVAWVGWIDMRQAYPSWASKLAIQTAHLEVIKGQGETGSSGKWIYPDDSGVIVVAIEHLPRFTANQFCCLRVQFEAAADIPRVEWIWQAGDDGATHALQLESDENTFWADAASMPAWEGNVVQMGLAIRSAQPVRIVSATLSPPAPSFRYLLRRVLSEWTYREDYRGSTINRLEGAGPATLLPLTLMAAISFLLCAVVFWRPRLNTTGPYRSRSLSMFSAIVTLWVVVTFSWICDMWIEAYGSARTYAGKSQSERRLQEPDARLYQLAQKVKAALPPPPQRLVVVSSGGNLRGSTNYQRTKLHYYLAPYNVLSRFQSLPPPSWHEMLTGDYVLVIDGDQESHDIVDGRIQPGYPATLILADGPARLYRIGDLDNG